jgi:serine protease AprX
VSNGLDADLEIPTAYLPYYTQISGTSMACPHVAGVVALMLDADSTLTPDDVKRIIRETATRMPVYGEFEVGAGYINAFAAVDKVFNRSRSYGRFVNPDFNAQLTTTWSNPENFSLMYVPQPPGPQATNTNTHRFTVEPGRGLLNVVITFGTNAATSETGNSMGLMLYPPGCQTPQTDPTAPPPPCAFNSGLALPALNAPQRQVIVRNPVAGQWVAEVRGVRGLAAVPQVSSPAGIAVPEQVNGYVKHATITLQDVADMQGHAAEMQIRDALLNRRIDLLADGTFQPDSNITRADFARTLALNAPLRQSLGASAAFSDVSGDLASIAEAITAKGSTLRDFFTAESSSAGAGLMSAAASTFNPAGSVSRLDLAVALVRALGLDAEAKAKANTDVTFGGQTLVDNADIPGALRGYVQIAIDKGLLEVYPAEVRQIGPGQFLAIPGPRVEPNALITRASMATKVNIFEQRFMAGN